MARLKAFFATKNMHKFQELEKITPSWIEIESLPKEIPTAPETGDTFIENSLHKALWYMKLLNAPVFADDSGLEIDALKGFPGVHSATFMAGESYTIRMEKILKMLEGEGNRKARFVCQAVFASPEGILLSVRGSVEGKIADEIRGKEGFGYDPIFIPDGYNKTFGELGSVVKSELSHRSKAFKRLFDHLYTIYFL